MGEAGRAGDEGDGGAAEPPAPAPGESGEVGARPPIIPGNVGSLDDVPEDAAGGVAAEEEPAVGHA